MGVTLFYTGGKDHNFKDRISDMKNMVLQKEDYDLSTEIGKENTWHAVNAMLLGSASTLLGFIIGDKLSQPFVKRQTREREQTAFMLGQLDAYHDVAKHNNPPKDIKR